METIDRTIEPSLRGRGPTEVALRTLRRCRGRYSAEQVSQIREAYLLDGMELAEIREKVWPKSTLNALWRIAIGRSYPEVPLTAKLQAAYVEAEARRKTPITPKRRE